MKRKLNCVLLVDDNDSDNFIHKRVLEKSGITENIAIAMNGKEALEFLTTKGTCGQPENSYSQPELIFLDINMPIMDGWEFLEEYKKLEAGQQGKIVFIMLTTSLNPVDKTKAEKMLESGCFQYKPLTLQMIDNILQNHFPEYL
ncbi:MAG: response regulator [Bacteroidetes bacterium]|nr:response regulator [Bacteroidota bacterium]